MAGMSSPPTAVKPTAAKPSPLPPAVKSAAEINFRQQVDAATAALQALYDPLFNLVQGSLATVNASAGSPLAQAANSFDDLLATQTKLLMALTENLSGANATQRAFCELSAVFQAPPGTTGTLASLASGGALQGVVTDSSLATLISDECSKFNPQDGLLVPAAERLLAGNASLLQTVQALSSDFQARQPAAGSLAQVFTTPDFLKGTPLDTLINSFQAAVPLDGSALSGIFPSTTAPAGGQELLLNFVNALTNNAITPIVAGLGNGTLINDAVKAGQETRAGALLNNFVSGFNSALAPRPAPVPAPSAADIFQSWFPLPSLSGRKRK
ncbi:hypothetical protein FOA52_009563 [Chlamydomonas sp. UWO 241]|nr:hypothetical protein FOA52_009563 [Chlamydomonas sp. UWO 241]